MYNDELWQLHDVYPIEMIELKNSLNKYTSTCEKKKGKMNNQSHEKWVWYLAVFTCSMSTLTLSTRRIITQIIMSKGAPRFSI